VAEIIDSSRERGTVRNFVLRLGVIGADVVGSARDMLTRFASDPGLPNALRQSLVYSAWISTQFRALSAGIAGRPGPALRGSYNAANPLLGIGLQKPGEVREMARWVCAGAIGAVEVDRRRLRPRDDLLWIAIRDMMIESIERRFGPGTQAGTGFNNPPMPVR
jgi:hypothetical protein